MVPVASGPHNNNPTASRARRYKFHPIQSLPPKHKKKKKFPYGWGSAQKCLSVVCRLSSVVCLSVVPNYFLNRWSDWDKFFLYKNKRKWVWHSGYKTDPSQNQILMGVIALAFFDSRSSRGPQRLLESAICYLNDPHYFQILSGVSFILLFDPRSSKGTYEVKLWKWGVSPQINIGLQIFSDLQKKIIFATTYTFQRALSRRNFEFLPWIKIIYCFQKKC